MRSGVAGPGPHSNFRSSCELSAGTSAGDLRYLPNRFRIDNISFMERSALRTRLYWIAAAYVAVIAVSAALIVMRYLQYATHPDDAAAYSGMWAGGDLILEMFIVGMFLLVSFVAALVIAESESAYTIYSKALVGISLTAPFSVAIISISAVSRSNSILGDACMYRLFASPLVACGIGMSRLFARFPRPKKLTVYALAIEGLTLALLVGLLCFSARH